jgi:hypothetical protein
MTRFAPRNLIGILLVCLVVLWQYAAFPQQAVRLELRVTDERPIKMLHSAPLIVQVPIQCDARGNLYFQGYDSQNLNAAPVNRISADGSEVSQISLRDAPGFEEGAVYDFAVSLQGEVYFLAARKKEEFEVVRFSSNGKYESAFRVGTGISPVNLAVFSTGEILISGSQKAQYPGEREGTPLLALFDRFGRFLLELAIARDPLPEFKLQDTIVPGMTLGIPGDDGNIYLLRRTEPPSVFVLSSSGVTLRRVVVRPPDDSYRVSSFRVYGGRLLVEFEALSPEPSGAQRVFSVWDSSTGEPIAEYVAPDSAKGIFACFSSEGLTLLVNKPNAGLYLLRARI